MYLKVGWETLRQAGKDYVPQGRLGKTMYLKAGWERLCTLRQAGKDYVL